MTWMLKNSAGEHDAMLTLGVMTVAVLLVRTLIAGLSITIGAKTFGAGAGPDAGVIGALLMPTLGAYVMRRNGIGSSTGVGTTPSVKEESK